MDARELQLLVPWGHVAAKAWGSPTNYPVLCIHGMLDNAGTFDRLIFQLPKNYYYVSIDLPGHGLSSHFPPGVPLEFMNYVLTLRYILEQLNWKKFYFIGHSLGAQLGLFYSIIYPDQIQKIITIEGFFPKIIHNENIITQIKTYHDAVMEIQKKKTDQLYTRDEIMHSLKYKRSFCLTNDAAQAIFKRSISEVEGMYKYNRDLRLKNYFCPIFNFDQMVSIYIKFKVKTLLFLTKSTLELLSPDHITMLKSIEENINLNIIYINGNHDVHNNYPERLSSSIINFLSNSDTFSKL